FLTSWSVTWGGGGFSGPTLTGLGRPPEGWPTGGFGWNQGLESEGESPMGWTDGRVELLKKLWADGLSPKQIAAELGGVTRNAVIGKVHRLGLSGRAKSTSSTAPRPRKARSPGHMLRVPG